MEGGTMESYMNRISNTGIVPVVKILEKEDAYPLAKALLNGGIDVIEVTYRSEHATSAIQTISEQLPDMLVGAGTVLSVEQAKEAVEAGAKLLLHLDLIRKWFNGVWIMTWKCILAYPQRVKLKWLFQWD